MFVGINHKEHVFAVSSGLVNYLGTRVNYVCGYLYGCNLKTVAKFGK